MEISFLLQEMDIYYHISMRYIYTNPSKDKSRKQNDFKKGKKTWLSHNISCFLFIRQQHPPYTWNRVCYVRTLWYRWIDELSFPVYTWAFPHKDKVGNCRYIQYSSIIVTFHNRANTINISVAICTKYSLFLKPIGINYIHIVL